MNKNVYKVILLVALLAITSACGKKKLDVSKFEAVCAKVARCDAKFQELAKMQAMQGKSGDPKEMCQTALAKWAGNKQFSALVPQVTSCLNDAKCEELSMSDCFTKTAQGLQLQGIK